MIEVFADVVCPFTHVGLRRLVDRRDELGASAVLRVRAWPLELINGEPLAADLVAERYERYASPSLPTCSPGSIRRGSRPPRSPR